VDQAALAAALKAGGLVEAAPGRAVPVYSLTERTLALLAEGEARCSRSGGAYIVEPFTGIAVARVTVPPGCMATVSANTCTQWFRRVTVSTSGRLWSGPVLGGQPLPAAAASANYKVPCMHATSPPLTLQVDEVLLPSAFMPAGWASKRVYVPVGKPLLMWRQPGPCTSRPWTRRRSSRPRRMLRQTGRPWPQGRRFEAATVAAAVQRQAAEAAAARVAAARLKLTATPPFQRPLPLINCEPSYQL
jgi:hypothetical protein